MVTVVCLFLSDFFLPSPSSMLKLPSDSPRMNIVASRDRFKAIWIEENSVMNYNCRLEWSRVVERNFTFHFSDCQELLNKFSYSFTHTFLHVKEV